MGGTIEQGQADAIKAEMRRAALTKAKADPLTRQGTVVNPKYATHKEEMAGRRERQWNRAADRRRYHVAGEVGCNKYRPAGGLWKGGL